VSERELVPKVVLHATIISYWLAQTSAVDTGGSRQLAKLIFIKQCVHVTGIRSKRIFRNVNVSLLNRQSEKANLFHGRDQGCEQKCIARLTNIIFLELPPAINFDPSISSSSCNQPDCV